jgi:hypothetical protein
MDLLLLNPSAEKRQDCGIELLGQDYKDRATRIGLPGQGCQDRAARTGLPVQGCQDKLHPRSGQQGQYSQDS